MPRINATAFVKSRRNFRRGWRLLALFLGWLHIAVARAEQTLEVYETYWPAGKIAPLVQDVLSPNDTLSVFKNKLIIKTSPAQHAQIDTLLREVDRPPRNLLISVRESNQTANAYLDNPSNVEYQEDDGRYRIQPQKNDSVVVYSGSSRAEQIEMRVVHRNTVSTASDDVLQQVRVLEGEEATLSLGEERPIQQVSVGTLGSGVSTNYQPAEKVLYVTAQISKKTARLDISSRSKKVVESSNNPTMTTSSIDTTLSAPLGLWTPIGGTTAKADDAVGTVTYSTRSRNNSDKVYEIKVDILP